MNIIDFQALTLEEQISLTAVQQNGYALEYVKEQTLEICLAAVQQSGCALEYVKEQTHEICLAAVQQSGCALEYVKEQTLEICLAAVKKHGYAYNYVKNKTPEIYLAAVKQAGEIIEHIPQTPELCLAAVQSYGRALSYVKKQTAEICIAAVLNDKDTIHIVRKEFREICMNYITPKLIPSKFIELPQSVLTEDLVDPITFEAPVKDELYAFLIEKDTYYLAGSLESLREMIKRSFRGSTIEQVFVPNRNCLVPTSELHWVRF